MAATMDIRNWLATQTKKTAESRKRRIEDDDDDNVIPDSPDVQIINKKKKSIHSTKLSTNKTKPEKKLKEVKAVNLFGDATIKRTEPIVKKETKKTETGIHSDDEFEKSLLDLDIPDEANYMKIIDIKQKNLNEHHKNDRHKTLHKHNEDSPAKVKVNGSHTNKSPLKSQHDMPPTSKDGIVKKLDGIKKEVSSNENHKKDSQKTLNKLSEGSATKVIDNVYHITNKSPSKSRHDIPSTLKDGIVKKLDGIKKEINETNKRKFAKFIDGDYNHLLSKHKTNTDTKTKKTNGDVTKLEKYDVTSNDTALDYEEPKNKKKRNTSLNESVLSDEERHERKRLSAKLYQNYLNRSGPKHLGAKEMPEGAPNCLKDYAFLLTGVLDSFEKEEIIDTINKYGGCVKCSISKKVTHVLAGDDAGPAKMAKAEELGIKIIHEDDFLKIIKDSNKQNKSEHNKERKDNADSKKSNRDKDKDKTLKSDYKKEKSEHKDKHYRNEMEVKKEKPKDGLKKELDAKGQVRDKLKSPIKIDLRSANESKSSSSIDKEESKPTTDIKSNVDTKIGSIMWVEKHKPQNVKQIIGQMGENSNVNKLINWLSKWYVNRKAKLSKPSPWAKNDDGGYFKAALLSGPPGVGKTTTVSLVCKQLGFDTVEYNASDTRNKTLIKEQIGELLTTSSLSAYAKGDTGKQAVTKKHVLVMDEVDGMAGNEDRGGLQELIGLIKSASVPIICMCNDRNSQKMRSLVNYCYDLRFNRPKVEQIKGAMRSICARENIKIPPDVLGQLIVSANQDVRQTMNLLSMWAIDPSRMNAGRLSKDAAVSKKDVKLGPWEAIRKVFSAEDHKTMSINDKSDLFFYDYSLAPLFVQENYLQVQPHCAKHEVLERISQAADSIAIGDVIDKRIRSSQAWSLLPMQAMYSSVLPGHYLSGHMAGQIQFPGWLGKNSRANKMHRLCQEIHAHTRLSTTGSKSSIYLDYATHLRDAIITPLIKERTDGIEHSIQVLESYNLLREDLDSLTELSVWPGQRNPTVLIDSKVKAGMTRTYNKKATALPYAPGSVKRARLRDDGLDDEDEMMEEEEDSSDLENDGLIKLQKKKSQQSKTSSSSDGPSTSKGKSNGKGNSGKGKKK